MSDTTVTPDVALSEQNARPVPTYAQTRTIARPLPRQTVQATSSSTSSPSPTSTDEREVVIYEPSQDSWAPVLATPAFLKALQPPPLPLWAVPHATTALTASRLSLLVARSTASTGFAIARTSTSFGFGAFKLALGGIGSLLDASLGLNGNQPVTDGSGPIAQTSIAAMQAAESIALAGINIGSGITNLALGGATSTIALLEDVYGCDEAMRTLEAFTRLVKDEWTTSLPSDPYPDGGLSRWSTIQVVKAAATWAALQSVTSELDGRKFAMHLDELDWGRQAVHREPPGSGGVLWEITDDQLFDSGAEITEATIKGGDEQSSETSSNPDSSNSEEYARQQLRRFASMCLGSYGSAGVLFFGVKLPSIEAAIKPQAEKSTVAELTPDNLAALARQHAQEELERTLGPHSPNQEQLSIEEKGAEEQLGDLTAGWTVPEGQSDPATPVEAVEVLPGSTVDQTESTTTTTSSSETTSALEAEDWGLRTTGALPRIKPTETDAAKLPRRYDYWGLLNGKHDSAILHQVAGVAPDATLEEDCDSSDEEELLSDARPEVIEQRQVVRQKLKEERKRRDLQGRRPPRFFILTDHPNRSITVLFRGTTTIDDIATDLACESSTFDEKLYWDDSTPARATDAVPYTVHGGMYEIALAMGRKDGPVHRVVEKALRRNEGYGLHLVGHSLGAGAASLLGLMWSNPDTATTSSKSGLPQGRPVQVFGFATPCVTDASLSNRARKLIHSFIYSYDVVPRFSLGHMRDIRSAAAWLCYANKNNPEESCDNILSRIAAYKRGKLDGDAKAKSEAEEWFMSIRTTLEANQHYSTLFPPGDVLWLTRHDDLILPADKNSTRIEKGPRLFRVKRPDVVFKQMIFTKSMLSSHLPHQYTRAIEEYL